MRKILAILAGVTVLATGLSVTRAMPVAAVSCNTSWTYTNGQNSFFSWTDLTTYQSADSLAYREQSDGAGGCNIQYAERMQTDHNSYMYNGFRYWVCGVHHTPDAYAIGTNITDTGWALSGWIAYGTCGPQADNDDPGQTNSGHSEWAPVNGGLYNEPFAYLHF